MKLADGDPTSRLPWRTTNQVPCSVKDLPARSSAHQLWKGSCSQYGHICQHWCSHRLLASGFWSPGHLGAALHSGTDTCSQPAMIVFPVRQLPLAHKDKVVCTCRCSRAVRWCGTQSASAILASHQLLPRFACHSFYRPRQGQHHTDKLFQCLTAGHAQKAGDLWNPSNGLTHLRAAIG